MSRQVLVVGGTGMIGSHIAATLAGRGDRVTIASRSTAGAYDPTAIAGIDRVAIDYTDPDLSPRVLEAFDTIIFAAGNDIRHVAADGESAAFWDRVQSVGVPRFAQSAKDAGVECFVQLGSYYHQLHPEWAATNPYVAARKAADEGARALAGAGFRAITLNPPSIVGSIPGRVQKGFARLIDWVRGGAGHPPLAAPPGGTNYLSVRSLVQAVAGAVDRGEGGRAYLVGDESLRYREYFQKLARAAGSDLTVEERDEECPYLLDRFIVQGRGNAIAYEPDPREVALLGYERGDIDRALAEIVAAVDASA